MRSGEPYRLLKPSYDPNLNHQEINEIWPVKDDVIDQTKESFEEYVHEKENKGDVNESKIDWDVISLEQPTEIHDEEKKEEKISQSQELNDFESPVFKSKEYSGEEKSGSLQHKKKISFWASVKGFFWLKKKNSKSSKNKLIKNY